MVEAQGGVAEEIWTYGHRNPLGIDIDQDGRLWVSEMGSEGGDELNLLAEGKNYGWSEASDGDHYDGGELLRLDSRRVDDQMAVH